jgi:ssDNA-binding Zn-finger/Zn-ribbon topoisomerase 1
MSNITKVVKNVFECPQLHKFLIITGIEGKTENFVGMVYCPECDKAYQVDIIVE